MYHRHVNAAWVLLLLCASSTQAATLLSDDFNDNSLDTSKWQVVLTSGWGSDVQETGGVAVLTNRGHLMTANQFNPATTNGLKITGSWTIKQDSGNFDYMQIYTRANTTTGGYADLTSGLDFYILSSGTQPTIGVNGAGMSVSNIVQTGTVSMAVNKTYLFEVIDDGAGSLSFQLTNAANPSETAKVTGTLTGSSSTNYIGFQDRENSGGTHIAWLDDVVIRNTIPDLDNHGRLFRSDAGKLIGAAYATQTVGGALWTGATNWTLERAASLNGVRTTVATGATGMGDAATNVPFLAPSTFDLDPGFESGGMTKWQNVAGGGGNSWAVVTTCTGYANPIGAYMLGLADGNARDGAHNLLLARSQTFTLAGGDLTFQLQGGVGSGDIPTGFVTLATTGSGSGYMGVALRDAITGEYLLTDRKDSTGNAWQTQGWTAAQLAAYVGRQVNLDVIDNFVGGWGWLGADAFSIPYTDTSDRSITPGSDFWFLTVNGQEVFAGQVADVPEPLTAVLFISGCAGLVARLRRRLAR